VIGFKVKNFKITIEYDGTRFCGWQRQKNDPSIQAEIEKALTTMTGQQISVIGSGRTDAGVHACAQVANFKCHTTMDAADFIGGLNRLTAEDIVIKQCTEVENSFHARYHAKSKAYAYKILNRATPAAIGRQYAWHIRKELNIEAMRSVIPQLIGCHDFKSFEGSGSPRTHTIRTVLRASLTQADDGYLVFEIEADGFLRFMVRNIVGTLVAVGLAKMTAEDFKQILSSRDRRQAGATAPAKGLFLRQVNY